MSKRNIPMPALVGPEDLTEEEKRQLRKCRAGRAPLADRDALSAVVAELGSGGPLDPYETVCRFAACSPLLAALLRARIGLSRPCRLHEHTQGDLHGLETDYLPLFPASGDRKVLRLTGFTLDIGKSFCVAEHGSNFDQREYNIAFTRALLALVSPDVLAGDRAKAVETLVASDVLGGALQGRFDGARLARLRADWPPSLAAKRDDFVLVTYLADASAHTEHRRFVDAETLVPTPCTASGDATLTHLFERGPDARLGLRDDRIVRALLPELDVADALVPSESFREVASADGVWTAELRLPTPPFDEMRDLLRRFAGRRRASIRGFASARWDGVRALTLTRDPSEPLTAAHCERDADDLTGDTGWTLRPPKPRTGFTVGLGLHEGTHARPSADVLARLTATSLDWHTDKAEMVAARWDGRQVKWHSQPAILVSGPLKLLPDLFDVARDGGWRRLTVMDRVANRTYVVER